MHLVTIALEPGLDGALALLNDLVNESADAAIDPNSDLITVLQIHGRLLDEANTLGSASHDDGTRQQRCALREESNSLPDSENLVAMDNMRKKCVKLLRWKRTQLCHPGGSSHSLYT